LIVITGASGLLGANILLSLQQAGQPVAGVYHAHPVRLAGAETVAADLADPPAAAEAVRKLRPSWVVHSAGVTNVDWAEQHPDFTRVVNVEATRHLARAAKQAGSGFVYISTDSVFDGNRGGYCEDDATAPVNVYARTKLEGEHASLEELPGCLVVRTNIYGWNAQSKNSLAEWILGRLESGQDVPGFADVTFAPILVNDLSDVLAEMMDRALSGVYHVTGSESCSKYDFACRLAEVFGCPPRRVRATSVDDSLLEAPRPRHTSLDTSRIVATLGRAMPDVPAGLRRFRALRDGGFVRLLKSMTGE
jgi:dTDP-4-dehydrorhamnose reductase